MKSDERIRAFLGIATLELENADGLKEKFMVKSIKMRDFAKIMGTMNLSEDGEVNNEAVANIMSVTSEVGIDMLKRSFENLSEDEIENLLVSNFQAISECIMKQVNSMMNGKSDKIDKIKTLQKKGRKAVNEK